MGGIGSGRKNARGGWGSMTIEERSAEMKRRLELGRQRKLGIRTKVESNRSLIDMIVNDPNKVVESIEKAITTYRESIELAKDSIANAERHIMRLSHMKQYFLETDTKPDKLGDTIINQ